MIHIIGLIVSLAYGQSGADLDFQKRCSAPGVLACEGFDQASDFTPAVWPNSGLYLDANGMNPGVRDTTIKASGASSLRIEIDGPSTAESSYWWQDLMPNHFAEGGEFYVQFRQRFDPNMINLGEAGLGGVGWKQVIFHNQTAGSCAAMEITTTARVYQFPIMYTDCGHGNLGNNFEFWTSAAGGDWVEQYNNPYPPGTPGDIFCLYSLESSPSTNKCLFYKTNTWMTFYYHVKIGTWGQPNSVIEAWAGYDGQPLAEFINYRTYILNKDTCADQAACDLGFNRIMLTPYMTGKVATASPTAYTWYDELIVSTQPISAPGAAVAGNAVPARPQGLALR